MALFMPPRAALRADLGAVIPESPAKAGKPVSWAELCAGAGAVIARRLRASTLPTRFFPKNGNALKQRKRHFPRSCFRRRRKFNEKPPKPALRRRDGALQAAPGGASRRRPRQDCAALRAPTLRACFPFSSRAKKTPAQGGRRGRAIGRPRRRSHGFEPGFAGGAGAAHHSSSSSAKPTFAPLTARQLSPSILELDRRSNCWMNLS